MLENLCNFVTVFPALAVFLVFRSSNVSPYKCDSTSSNFLVSPWIRLLISVSLEVLFKSSPCMLCEALSIPKNCRMSRLVLDDASRVLAEMSSTNDKSSSSGMLSISKSVGNSLLSLVAALKGLSNAGGVLSTPKKIFIVFIPSNLSLKAFCAKNSPVCFVKGSHLSPL